MKILYVAKHNSGDNDDEGAIAHALRSLGHEVITLAEHQEPWQYRRHAKADFLLFHKWEETGILKKLKLPKVFWYFDLVEYPDPSLYGRNRIRREWMNRTIPLVDLGFCTDGDWVIKQNNHKVIRLLQGADERYTGFSTKRVCPMCKRPFATIPVLFTGIRRGGRGRASFVDEMKEQYGERFCCRRGLHGRALADEIGLAKIVVAPDHPITHNYWSNRVYLSLGFGAFLLHPYCKTLGPHYQDGKEIVYYRNRTELFEKIEYYLGNPEERLTIQRAGLARTLEEHTYTHRCQKLIKIVKDRLS